MELGLGSGKSLSAAKSPDTEREAGIDPDLDLRVIVIPGPKRVWGFVVEGKTRAFRGPHQ